MEPSRLADWLLSADPERRARLHRAALGLGAMVTGVVTVNYFAFVGLVEARGLLGWSACALAAVAAVWVLLRTRAAEGSSDPGLALPQMLVGLVLAAWLYTLLGPARGAVFPIVMVLLMFGLFAASARQMAGVGAFAVLVFAVAMGWMAWRDPARYPPAVELGHFLVVATMTPAAAVLAGRLSTLRERLRAQRSELEQALVRIEELATHDALTGLVNRRHMEALLEGERQRCVRSGHVFCVAVLDVDGLAAFNERHGRLLGDGLLQAFAREAQATLRLSDRLARWEGGSFVLLLSDTRATLARGGVERLRERIAGVQPASGAHAGVLTVSAGLTEHRAGETVQQALQRARQALLEAKAAGRDRLVVS